MGISDGRRAIEVIVNAVVTENGLQYGLCDLAGPEVMRRSGLE
jgi:hypothetical protein